MLTPRIRAALVVLAASAGLSACTSLGPYGGVGVGVGSGYGSYGYDPYYSGYGYGSPYGYAGYGSGYGYDPYGWYNGYYYPGSGYWVYTPDRHRRALTAEERAYWEARLAEFIRNKRGLTGTSSTAAVKENWSGFNRRATVSGTSATATGQADQHSLRQISEARRQAQVQRLQSLREAQSERAQARIERQSTTQDDSDTRPTRRRPRN